MDNGHFDRNRCLMSNDLIYDNDILLNKTWNDDSVLFSLTVVHVYSDIIIFYSSFTLSNFNFHNFKNYNINTDHYRHIVNFGSRYIFQEVKHCHIHFFKHLQIHSS